MLKTNFTKRDRQEAEEEVLVMELQEAAEAVVVLPRAQVVGEQEVELVMQHTGEKRGREIRTTNLPRKNNSYLLIYYSIVSSSFSP
jgi:hypothetical protein